MDKVLLITGIILIIIATVLVIYFKKHPLVYDSSAESESLYNPSFSGNTTANTLEVKQSNASPQKEIAKTEVLCPENRDG